MIFREHFPSPLVIEALTPLDCDNRQSYVLKQDFAYFSPAFGQIAVPSGLLTDFASVPRLVWSYLSPEDPCILFGSIVHDWLYQQGGKLPLRTLSRAECDSVLREAMLICGARPTQAAVVYRSLCLFGGGHWPKP